MFYVCFRSCYLIQFVFFVRVLNFCLEKFIGWVCFCFFFLKFWTCLRSTIYLMVFRWFIYTIVVGVFTPLLPSKSFGQVTLLSNFSCFRSFSDSVGLCLLGHKDLSCYVFPEEVQCNISLTYFSNCYSFKILDVLFS